MKKWPPGTWSSGVPSTSACASNMKTGQVARLAPHQRRPARAGSAGGRTRRGSRRRRRRPRSRPPPPPAGRPARPGRRAGRGSPSARSPASASGSITDSGGRDAVRLEHGLPARPHRPSPCGRPPPTGCRRASRRRCPGMAIGSHSSIRRMIPGRSESSRIVAAPPSDSPSATTSVIPRCVEDGQGVARAVDVAEAVDGAGVVAGPVAPQVDPHHPVLAPQAPGQRVEHPGAEPVGVQEQQGRAVAAPVEGGDAQAVVLDGELVGIGAVVHHRRRYTPPCHGRPATSGREGMPPWVVSAPCRLQQEPACAVRSARPRSSW